MGADRRGAVTTKPFFVSSEIPARSPYGGIGGRVITSTIRIYYRRGVVAVVVSGSWESGGYRIMGGVRVPTSTMDPSLLISRTRGGVTRRGRRRMPITRRMRSGVTVI